MVLIVYYLSIVAASDVAAAFLCLLIERYAPTIALPIFIGLYFGILWAAWVIAVRLSAPKAGQEGPTLRFDNDLKVFTTSSAPNAGLASPTVVPPRARHPG